MLPDNWTQHRRSDDREPVGWIVPEGDGFRPFDALGRRVTAEPVDWLEAEEILDALGIGLLADRYLLVLPDGTERPVRIAEAGPEGITVVADEFGSASAVGLAARVFDFPSPLRKSFERPMTHAEPINVDTWPRRELFEYH